MKKDSLLPTWFSISDVQDKINQLPSAITEALGLTQSIREFNLGRDVQVVAPAELPPKPGLASKVGQARLLHDLASIELQAMELAVRTLTEFPEAHPEFRSELAEIAMDEGRHFSLCLKGIEALGFRWGDWPAHISLWNTVGAEDTLLDRILIVHRYLEGSGLDAGDSILRRLTGVPGRAMKDIVNVIVREEVRHVAFGSRWYRTVAEENGVDPERDFARRIERIARVAPRRERLARDLRLRAGFTLGEISALEECQWRLRS